MTPTPDPASDFPPPPPIRIACVGASVTFGRGLPNRRVQCYPAVLQRRFDAEFGADRCRVRNFGYSGATASRGSNEPYWDTPSFTSVTRFAPELTLIMLGTNDAQFANERARSSFTQDLVELIQHFESFGGRVALSDPPPAFPPVPEIDFEALTEVIRPAIRSMASQQGYLPVDFLTPLQGCRNAFPDGLHPDAEVAAEIARLAFEALKTQVAGLLAARASLG